MIRKGTIGFGVMGLVACAMLAIDSAPAHAGPPLSVKPALYQAAEGTAPGASVQLVHHRHGWYGAGYGYRPYGYGMRFGMYRPYPVYAAPIYGAPMYAAPVYGYPGYAYPAYGYGYGYGYRGCW
jgi:hypothetical protein